MNWRIGSIVAFWFLVGVVIYVIIKNWGVEYWWDPATWQIVAAIATWLLAGGVGFAILQVRQARKSTNAQVAVELFKELRNYETVEKLRLIYDLPYDFSNPDDFKILEDSKKKDIEYILDRFDVLAALVAERIVDDKLAIDTYAGVTVLRCWYQLHHYIRKVRDERGYFGDNIEAFTRRSFDYFRNKGIQVTFCKKGAEDKPIDLMRQLEKAELCPRSLKEIKRDRKNRARAEKIKKRDKGEA